LDGTAPATEHARARENDKTFAVRDTAGGSKHRTTIGSTIKGAFRLAVKAVTGTEDDAPKVRKKRKGDSEGQIVRLKRWITRPYSCVRQGGTIAVTQYLQTDLKKISEFRLLILSPFPASATTIQMNLCKTSVQRQKTISRHSSFW
jgi:hypothetical protein